MNNSTINLLLSARDPGAALSIKEIALEAKNDLRFNVKLIAQEPAYSMLKSAGLNVEIIILPKILSKKSVNQDIFLKIKKILTKIKPNVILTGISGPNAGIDELLLYQAGNIKTYTIQDFWGYVNLTLGVPASTYFVIDKEAAMLTKNIVDVTALPVGSIKHKRYSEINIDKIRDAFRKKNKISNNEKLIGFYGQPFEEYKEYIDTIEEFFKAIKRNYVKCTILYRPHPKETNFQIEKTIKVIKSYNKIVFIDNLSTIEDSLAGCDVVVSCFSTCGYDYLMLNFYYRKPLGIVIYLLFNKKIYNFFLGNSFPLNKIPILSEKIVFNVLNKTHLDDILCKMFDNTEKIRVWKNIKKVLHEVVSINKILNYIAKE